MNMYKIAMLFLCIMIGVSIAANCGLFIMPNSGFSIETFAWDLALIGAIGSFGVAAIANYFTGGGSMMIAAIGIAGTIYTTLLSGARGFFGVLALMVDGGNPNGQANGIVGIMFLIFLIIGVAFIAQLVTGTWKQHA